MDYTRLRMLGQLGHLDYVEEPTAPEGGGEGQEASQEGAEGSGDEQDGESGDESQEGEQEPFDSARALDKIRKLNSEARNLRDRAQEAEKKAAGTDELTKTVQTKDSEILRLRVALKHGLPEGLANRLQGSSEEELLADAEELMGLFSSKEPPSQSPKRKAPARTPNSAEDGVDIDKLALDQLSG